MITLENYRLVTRDGVLTAQYRIAHSQIKSNWKWWQIHRWNTYKVETTYGEWIDLPIREIGIGFKVGDRVVATQDAGFHKGAHGVIEYIDPSGKHWVMRDGASKAVYYMAGELEHEK
jgi:hypothetical protein